MSSAYAGGSPSIYRTRIPEEHLSWREGLRLVLANPPHFLHTVCVERCTVHNDEGHRRCRIFAMQRRRACIGGHGTGGGGTLPPPLGTTTHLYIFPYSLFGRCTDIHAIWVLAVVLHPIRVLGRRSNMSGSLTVSSCRT